MPQETPRRILAVWCRDLAIDRWRLGEGLAAGEGGDAHPLALIAETARGPRIAAANPAGLAAGAAPGMMLADARALCPAIAVAPSDPAGDLALLEALALWARRWGPWSAIDPPDGLIVDVTGVAHLFGGEVALIADARARFARRGLAVRLAIAPTAGAAWALAHHGPAASDHGGAILAARDDPAERLGQLPVAALRLDEDTVLLLKRLGLKRLAELHGVARDSLVRRFRNRRAPAANPLVRMDQLLGIVPEPLLPVIAHAAPLVQRRLIEPIRHRALLDRVVVDLAADMARTLEGAGQGARRLELGLWRVDGEVLVRSLELAAASRDPGHIAGLFGRKLDDLDAGLGIELVRLRSAWTEPMALTQRDFEAAAEAHGTSLAACIDRLSVRLGPDAVRRPVPRASHIPERAQRWQPPLECDPAALERCGPGSSPGAAMTSVMALQHRTQPPGWTSDAERAAAAPAWPDQDFESGFHARPLKLLDRPEPIAVLYATPDGLPRRFRWRGQVHEIARAEGPERLAPEWWRERSSARLRDYYRIEDDAGRRYWIYRRGLAGDGRGAAPEWFLHGLCG